MLFDHYQPPDLKITRQAELAVAEQKKVESIQDFAYRLEKLAIEGYPDGEMSVEARENMLVTRFCQGLLDKRVHEIVWNRRPATLSMALSYARHAQVPGTLAGKDEKHRLQQVTFSRSNSSERTPLPPTPMKEKSACRRCGKVDHLTENCRNRSTSRSSSQERKRDLSKVRCFYCDEVGHYERDCVAKQSGKLPTRPQTPTRDRTPTRTTAQQSPKQVQCFQCRGYGHVREQCPTKVRIERSRSNSRAGSGSEQ